MGEPECLAATLHKIAYERRNFKVEHALCVLQCSLNKTGQNVEIVYLTRGRSILSYACAAWDPARGK